MISEDEFWLNIIHNQEDVSKGRIFFNNRGFDLHVYVWEYLQSIKSGQISYSQIATTIRYDKRIRRIIYKYIGFFEEYMRAYISNKYRNNPNGFLHTIKVERLINKYKSLFIALENADFGTLIKQIDMLNDNDKNYLFNYVTYTYKSLDALRVLRNQVGHNRFLLNNLHLLPTYGENASLHANIKNLYQYLPLNLKKQFKYEIEQAQYDNKETKEYQTDWELVSESVITI